MMARERGENNKDVSAGPVVKDKNRKLVTDKKEMLHGENRQGNLPRAVAVELRVWR